MRTWLLTAAIMLGSSAAAQSLPGDPAEGRIFALGLCAECHVVVDGQKPPGLYGVPSFAAIAADPAVTAIGLHVFLRTPHDRMPNLMVAPSKVDDVISYILSLREERPRPKAKSSPPVKVPPASNTVGPEPKGGIADAALFRRNS